MKAEAQEQPATTPPPGFWAICEFMGHRKLAGYVTETAFAGKQMLKVEAPQQHYSPAALFGITEVSEQIARAFAANMGYRPFSAWEVAIERTPRLGAGEALEPFEAPDQGDGDYHDPAGGDDEPDEPSTEP
jgi:hypothetical protein